MLIKILMCIKIQFIFNNLNQSPIKKRNFFYYINLSRCKIVKKITYSYVHIKMKHFLSPSKPVEPLIKSLNPHSPVLNVKNILHSLFHRQKRKKKTMKIFHLTVRSDYSSRVDGSPACFTNLHLSLSSKRGNAIPELGTSRPPQSCLTTTNPRQWRLCAFPTFLLGFTSLRISCFLQRG